MITQMLFHVFISHKTLISLQSPLALHHGDPAMAAHLSKQELLSLPWSLNRPTSDP